VESDGAWHDRERVWRRHRAHLGTHWVSYRFIKVRNDLKRWPRLIFNLNLCFIFEFYEDSVSVSNSNRRAFNDTNNNISSILANEAASNSNSSSSTTTTTSSSSSSSNTTRSDRSTPV
jgi:hypothetical protein